MQTSHKQLFGGALVGAGIAVSAAMTTTATADFIAAVPTGAGYSDSVISASGNAPSVNLFEYTYDAVFLAQSYSGNGLDASTYAGTNLMGVSLNLTDTATWNTNASVRSRQYFTVEDGREVTFEWDFTNADLGFAQVIQVGVGNIFSASDPTAGSVTLNLTPGNTYYFFGQVIQFGNVGGGFARLTSVIPAPGALAVLGIAGMIGGRRRRRS